MPNHTAPPLGFTKLVDDLVRLAAHAGVKYRQLVIVLGIAQRIALCIEHEPRGFYFLAQAKRVNPVPRFRIPQPRPGFRDVVNDQVDAARLEGIEKSFVESGNVRGSHERIVQIVIVLRGPNDVEFLGHAKIWCPRHHS